MSNIFAGTFAGSALVMSVVIVLASVSPIPPAVAAKLVTLHAFCTAPAGGNCPDGEGPVSRLRAIGSNLYGGTTAGGRLHESTLFAATPSGGFTTLQTFCELSSCNGAGPGNYLTRGPKGSLYGVTMSGGAGNGGTIFQLDATGSLTTLYQFCALKNCLDGATPVSVVKTKAGDLVGTTDAGGAHREGTIFIFQPGGVFHVLHNFCWAASCTDGNLAGALFLARDGNFYGTTAEGGAVGAGTIYRMAPDGTFTTLYSFCSVTHCLDGEDPTPSLVEGSDGNLYGTTSRGGQYGQGTVYRVTTTGTFTTLHTFCSETGCSDGASPQDGLVFGAGGSFIGAAAAGGKFFHGLIFEITTAGTYSIIYNFCAKGGCYDGSTPMAAPVLGPLGQFYGTTISGGQANLGTVYQLAP